MILIVSDEDLKRLFEVKTYKRLFLTIKFDLSENFRKSEVFGFLIFNS